MTIIDWFIRQPAASCQTSNDNPSTDLNPKPTLQTILEVVPRTEQKLDHSANQGTYTVAAQQETGTPPATTVATTLHAGQRLVSQCPSPRELKSLVIQI